MWELLLDQYFFSDVFSVEALWLFQGEVKIFSRFCNIFPGFCPKPPLFSRFSRSGPVFPGFPGAVGTLGVQTWLVWRREIETGIVKLNFKNWKYVSWGQVLTPILTQRRELCFQVVLISLPPPNRLLSPVCLLSIQNKRSETTKRAISGSTWPFFQHFEIVAPRHLMDVKILVHHGQEWLFFPTIWSET